MNPDGTPDEEDIAFYARYGPWDPMDVAGAAGLMQGFGEPWWVVGGHAIEAFSGVSRHHEDCDLVFFAKDLARFREHIGDRFHLWAVGSGALRPLNDRFPELPEWAGQVWLREHALAPWRLDCPVNPDVGGRWQSKRDQDHVADLDQVTWVDEAGIRFLLPEIVLVHKALLDRTKDLADLEAAWPLMSQSQQDWLRQTVARLYPDHGWNDRLAAD